MEEGGEVNRVRQIQKLAREASVILDNLAELCEKEGIELEYGIFLADQLDELATYNPALEKLLKETTY